MQLVNGDHVQPEPVVAPLPSSPLTHYLLLYAYPSGQVEFHCSHLDPALNFKLLAVAADALSNACRKMQDDVGKKMQDEAAHEESRLHRV